MPFMQARFTFDWRHLLVLLAAAGGLMSCGTPPTGPPRVGSERLLAQAERQVREGNHAGASTTYEQIAQNSPGELHDRYLLRAAHESVRIKDQQRAQKLLSQTAATLPGEDFTLRAQVVAAIALLNQQPNVALTELGRISEPLPRDAAAEILELKTQALFSLHQPARAISTALERERLSNDPAQIRENRRLIWQGLKEDAAAGADFTAPRGSGPILEGWLALGRVALSSDRNPFTARAELAQWQSQYSSHPANEFLAQEIVPAWGAALQYPAKIALVLPLSGKQQAAGIAIRDGFLAAFFQQDASTRPSVSLYDSAAQGAVTAYRRAVADGVQFIVGPLTKEDAVAVAESGPVSVPTLALNNLPDAATPPALIYQFSLDPEEEARQVAGKVITQGHLNGVALLPNSALGQRLQHAFSSELTTLGGTVLATRYYAPDAQDFSDPVTALLLTDESRARKNALASRLGVALEFEPRPRGDVGFVFITGSPAQGRSLRPALRFQLPGSLPIYSTSEIFEPDEEANSDLEGLMFLDMPWVISPDEVSSKLRAALTNYWPKRSKGRARLYAFGFDAYRLVPILKSERSNARIDVPGMTGRLSLDGRGRIHRTLEWAQIVDGKVRPLDAPPGTAGSN